MSLLCRHCKIHLQLRASSNFIAILKETVPDIAPLFGYRSSWRYACIQGEDKSKYSVIKNFCSHNFVGAERERRLYWSLYFQLLFSKNKIRYKTYSYPPHTVVTISTTCFNIIISQYMKNKRPT